MGLRYARAEASASGFNAFRGAKSFAWLFSKRFAKAHAGTPPPFSSMKSTPAASKARLMTSSVARRGWGKFFLVP
jgi:hypothetical protein